MLTNTTCDFNNALVNADINAVEVLFVLSSLANALIN